MSPANVALIRGDPARVIGELTRQIGIQVGQDAAHFVRVFLIDAEDDGFSESVGLL